MTRVTVITVVRNAAATIGDTLDSVAVQTWPDIEYIVIDGGSTDGTVDLVRNHPVDVSMLVSEPDTGIYDAMNKGLALATGDVVGFLNADDFYASDDVVARMAAAFGQGDIDAVYGDICYLDAQSPERVIRFWQASEFVPGSFAKGWCPPHPAFFVRRHKLVEHGGFDLNAGIAADNDLMARLLEVSRIRASYIPGVAVHMLLGGVTNQSVRSVWRQNLDIVRNLRRHGLKVSWTRFLLGKLELRWRQYRDRPA